MSRLMKGLVVERVEMIGVGRRRDFGTGHRAAASSLAEPCQKPVDTKALTGKGNLHALRQLEAEMDKLEQHMKELSAASKKVHGIQIYLMLHRRHSSGYIFLRWREAGGDKRHLSWEEAADIYLTYTERLRGWYSDITGRAQLANEAHNHLRNEYRATRRRLETSGRSVFARQIR